MFAFKTDMANSLSTVIYEDITVGTLFYKFLLNTLYV